MRISQTAVSYSRWLLFIIIGLFTSTLTYIYFQIKMLCDSLTTYFLGRSLSYTIGRGK
jgi:hypothetical protein